MSKSPANTSGSGYFNNFLTFLGVVGLVNINSSARFCFIGETFGDNLLHEVFIFFCKRKMLEFRIIVIYLYLN